MNGGVGRGRRTACGLGALALGAGLAWAALTTGGCRRSPPEQGPVVEIVPSADLAPTTVAEGGALAITYRWRTGPTFGRPARDYHALVHFVDDEGATLLTDDHDPEPATSTWGPSREYDYTRTLFAPSFYRLRLSVRVGLFLEGQRLALQGREIGRHEYEVATLTVVTRPPGDQPIRFGEGWALHSEADDPLRPTRWMLGYTGSVLVRNPREDSLLLFEAVVAPTRVGNWPVAHVSLGPATWSLPLRVRKAVLVKLRVPGTAWEGRDSAALRLTLRSEADFDPREPVGGGEGLGLRGIVLQPLSSTPAELAAGALEPAPAQSGQ